MRGHDGDFFFFFAMMVDKWQEDLGHAELHCVMWGPPPG